MKPLRPSRHHPRVCAETFYIMLPPSSPEFHQTAIYVFVPKTGHVAHHSISSSVNPCALLSTSKRIPSPPPPFPHLYSSSPPLGALSLPSPSSPPPAPLRRLLNPFPVAHVALRHPRGCAVLVRVPNPQPRRPAAGDTAPPCARRRPRAPLATLPPPIPSSGLRLPSLLVAWRLRTIARRWSPLGPSATSSLVSSMLNSV